jgi:hypothetical protein
MHNAHTHVKIKFYSLVCHFLPVEVRTYNYTIHHSPKATPAVCVTNCKSAQLMLYVFKGQRRSCQDSKYPGRSAVFFFRLSLHFKKLSRLSHQANSYVPFVKYI